MVLGLRSKNNKKGTSSVQVDYTVHIQEIRPWPPSQSLKSHRPVVLLWENGDRNSGSTSPVVPSVGDGKIAFDQSFKLQVTLSKEAPARGNDTTGTFQKNVLELNLYETRRDKTVKGQHLASAVIDLAEHGIIRDVVSVSAPVNCKRSFKNTVQPLLSVKLQPSGKDGGGSSSRGESMSKEASESVSALMNEEYAEEAEIASFTDDDVSSHSSLAHSTPVFEGGIVADSPPQKVPIDQFHSGNRSEAVKDIIGVSNAATDLSLESVPAKQEMKSQKEVNDPNESVMHQSGKSSRSSSVDSSYDFRSSENGGASVSDSPRRHSTLILETPETGSSSSSSFVTCEGAEVRSGKNVDNIEEDYSVQEVQDKDVDCRANRKEDIGKPIIKEGKANGFVDKIEPSDIEFTTEEKQGLINIAEPDANFDEDGISEQIRNEQSDIESTNGKHHMLMESESEGSLLPNSEEKLDGPQQYSIEVKYLCDNPQNHSSAPLESPEHTADNQMHRISEDTIREPVRAETPTFSQKLFGGNGSNNLSGDRLKNMKSVRSPPDTVIGTTLVTKDHCTEDVKEIDILEDECYGGRSVDIDVGTEEQESKSSSSDKVKHVSKNKRHAFPTTKIQELEHRVEMLEGELREAAAIEIGLYSIVAEHGSSAHKVHAPARRLSRLYIHASKQFSEERAASAARSAVSGLVSVAKACGNDVPRLTFWLSNSVVLRTIITQSTEGFYHPTFTGRHAEANGAILGLNKKSSPLKWESTRSKREKFISAEEFNDWEDPNTFTAALEKIEAWMFSRIIESVWWQTLTPYMQSTNGSGEVKMDSSLKKNYKRRSSLGDQEQANFSIDLWKKAFKDACERLCPVRAGGHECGCLTMLVRLIMEQSVTRLDVAMFNAILRESTDDIPTDPVSDPICDLKVLPVPAGKSSFGAGVQLKNAVGNWSRWLTDLFGIDDDDCAKDENEQDDDRQDVTASFKAFHLLNALSDLLMLPKDMLLNKSIRKEVCPTFSASMIKQILERFVPDEFCPDPIPDVVLEALDSEDPLEKGEEAIRNFPCNAAPITYTPPSVPSVVSIIGDVQSQSLLRRSGSSVLRKCHTSDDELDELDSPLASILMDKSLTPIAMPKQIECSNAIRYGLLREVWRDED